MPPPHLEPSKPTKPETPTYPLWERFDRTNLGHLSLLLAVFTLFFAGIYAFLLRHDCKDGLKPCDWVETIPYALDDGLYFSLVTETTLGYGDMIPHGYSRIVACLQVIGGLGIAGLFVTKLTSGPRGKTKVLVDRMSGAWIEFCDIGEGNIRTSLIHIRMEKGLLRYDGINFDESELPEYLGIFEGSSEPTNAINGPEIWFDYSNLEGDDSAFKSGRTSLCFSIRRDHPSKAMTLDEKRARRNRPYDFFRGFAKDKDKGLVPMFGYRLGNRGEAKLATSRSYTDAIQLRRSKLVRAWLPIYEYKAHVYEEIREQHTDRGKPGEH